MTVDPTWAWDVNHPNHAHYQHTKLNLGCGHKLALGYVNVDIYAGPGVDVVHDLDTAPWPWRAGSIEEILAFDIFEHVRDAVMFMNECHRVLASGGKLTIRTSHWRMENAYTDPTHVRFPTRHTFDFWIPGTELGDQNGEFYRRGNSGYLLDMAFEDGQEQVFILRRNP